MRLTEPWFAAKFIGEIAADSKSYRRLLSIEGAQGVLFWCPCGYNKPEYPIDGPRPHGCLIIFANPRNAPPAPADFGPASRHDPNVHPRWQMSGSGLDDLTLSPSIATNDPECWHGYVTAGAFT